MTTPPLHVVTGAFGYSGKYIARRLLDRGVRVATLTNSPGRPTSSATACGRCRSISRTRTR